MSKNRKKARKNGKSLLNERTIRRWQSLAAINEMGSYGEAYDAEEREEDMDEDMDMDMDMDEEPDMDMDMDEEPDMDMDMGDESEADDELEISDEELEGAEPLLRKLSSLATSHLNKEEDGDNLGDDLMSPAGDEGEGEEPEFEELSDLDDEEEDEELAENLSRLERLNVNVVDQNKIVKEVMKRVTKRLLQRLK